MNPICIVDDNPGHALLTREALLELFDFRDVLEFRGGGDILRFLETRSDDIRPTLILLDLCMPNLDGFEVLARLRKDERFDDIPIVVVSLSDAVCDVVRAVELGANAYLFKQFDFEEYKRSIRRIGEHWGIGASAPEPLLRRA